MKQLKKKKGIETLKTRYGYLFVFPWIIGLILFFAYPILQSVLYTFSKVTLNVGEMRLDFIGFDNIRQVLLVDSKFTNNLGASVGKIAYTVPAILVISLILGVMLNGEFKGRFLFRVMYFLPVIIASGAVLKLLFTYQSSNITNLAQEDVVSANMIDISSIIEFTGLPSQIGDYISTALSGIMNIVWNCGVQIVLFIAGMQTIPDLLYEVSKVEGATKWEEFWFITIPMLSPVIILVIVFTVVDLMTAQNDNVMTQAYTFMQSQNYGEASAMLWIYFLIVGAFTGIVLLLFKHFCMKRWE